jgi:hypothetical protein
VVDLRAQLDAVGGGVEEEGLEAVQRLEGE